jgi:adenylate kinase family enzyme
MDSDFTLAHVSKRIKELAKGGESIIFSGSPRTVLEAFGSKKNRGLVAVLQELYDKNSIIFIVLKITKEQALARNSKRLICSVCQTPLLGNAIPSSLKSCPFCGGSLYRRTLDDPKTILIRFKEYEEKTVPIIKKLQERKMIVHTVSASAMPNIIFKRISKLIV